MPINFPDNPTDNQEFNGYIYDATRGVWDVKLASDPLGTISIDSPEEGQSLVFDGTNWINQEVATPASVKTIDSDSIAIDFSDGIPLEKRSVAGDVTVSGTSYTAGASKKIAFTNNGESPVTISFPADWYFVTDKPGKIGAGVTNILELESFTTAASGVTARWYGPIGFSPYTASGGLETTTVEDGVTYKVHTFNTGDIFTVSEISETATAEVLVVAGGGSGGSLVTNRAAGGGAGGLVYIPNFTMNTAGNYTVSVGAGGSVASNGSNSSISGGGRTITAIGGGHGGYTDGTDNATSGGSGGGNWYPGYPGAEATQLSTTSDGQTTYSDTGFGNPGGQSGGVQPYGAGGGGAGEPGSNFNGPDGPKGGDGVQLSISGTNTYYAGGGSSAGFNSASEDGAYAGGLGGGGVGYNLSYNVESNGETNTGGGGGSGGPGGSGIVIIRYPITNPN